MSTDVEAILHESGSMGEGKRGRGTDLHTKLPLPMYAWSLEGFPCKALNRRAGET